MFKEYTPTNASIDIWRLDINVKIINPPNINKSFNDIFASVKINNTPKITSTNIASTDSASTIGKCSDILAVEFPFNSLKK